MKIPVSRLFVLPLFLAMPAAAQETTAADQVEALVQRFYDAWNEQDFVAAEDLVSDVFIRFDLNDRREPQTWTLQKIQRREAFLDGIVSEWTGLDGRDYNPETHQYTKEVEFYDIHIQDGLAVAIVRERRVGLDGPHGDWTHNAWLAQEGDGAGKIADDVFGPTD